MRVLPLDEETLESTFCGAPSLGQRTLSALNKHSGEQREDSDTRAMVLNHVPRQHGEPSKLTEMPLNILDF